MYTSKIWISLVLGFGFIVLLIGIFRGETGVSRYLELREGERVLAQAVERLEAENLTLQEEISKIQSSPAYAEKLLKDKYHITEPGESIVFFAE